MSTERIQITTNWQNYMMKMTTVRTLNGPIKFPDLFPLGDFSSYQMRASVGEFYLTISVVPIKSSGSL